MDKIKQLSTPFESHEIGWCAKAYGLSNDEPWVKVIPYITRRAIQDRLDEVFGVFGWQNHTKQISANGFLVGISVKNGNKWLTKWDGAEGSNTNGLDMVNSGSSNALKRACALFGIGRYLDDLDDFWADCTLTENYYHSYGNVLEHKTSGKLIAWKKPKMPSWAMPGFDIQQHLEDMKQTKNLHDLELTFTITKKSARVHQDKNLLKTAIEIKEIKKAQFNNEAALNVSEDTKAITEWLQRQTNALSLEPDIASIKSAYKATCRELKE